MSFGSNLASISSREFFQLENGWIYSLGQWKSVCGAERKMSKADSKDRFK